MAENQDLPLTLIDLLSNALILGQIAPLLPIQTLLRLTQASKSIRQLLFSQPDVWKYLNLSSVKGAVIDTSPIDVGGMNWRYQRMDEALSEDEFYAGPLRGIFSNLNRKRLLQNVQTLVLDGLSVPADLVHEILSEDKYNVRVLSIRGAKNLNEPKLQQTLRYAVRPTRAEGTPRLKALYFFGPKDHALNTASTTEATHSTLPLGVMSSHGAQIGAEWNDKSTRALRSHLCDEQIRWYSSTGIALKRPYSWAETLQACKGIISFDAVLCRGPRHDISKVSSQDFLQPTIATVALGPKGCEICHSIPELPARFGDTDDSTLPLLGPAPLFSSRLRAALRPDRQHDGSFPDLFLRCEDCLRARWCEQCNRFWCEDCYAEPVSRLAASTGQQSDRTEFMQQIQAQSADERPRSTSVKVFSKLCVEHCLVAEMMAGAGSNGMWG